MQQFIVGLIVVCAAWAVLLRYAPVPIKRGLRAALVHILRRCGWERAAQRCEAEAQASGSCGSGCGSCGSCGPDSELPRNEFMISAEALKRTARR